MKSTAKLEVQVICGFFIHYVGVKKIIKAVKFQKVGFKPISSKQMHLLRIYISPKPQPLINTRMATLSEGSDAFDYFISLFVTHVAQFTPQVIW